MLVLANWDQQFVIYSTMIASFIHSYVGVLFMQVYGIITQHYRHDHVTFPLKNVPALCSEKEKKL